MPHMTQDPRPSPVTAEALMLLLAALLDSELLRNVQLGFRHCPYLRPYMKSDRNNLINHPNFLATPVAKVICVLPKSEGFLVTIYAILTKWSVWAPLYQALDCRRIKFFDRRIYSDNKLHSFKVLQIE